MVFVMFIVNGNLFKSIDDEWINVISSIYFFFLNPTVINKSWYKSISNSHELHFFHWNTINFSEFFFLHNYIIYYIVCYIIRQIMRYVYMYNICKLSVNKMYLYEHSNQHESEACWYLRGLCTIIILTKNIKIKCHINDRKKVHYLWRKKCKDTQVLVYIFMNKT